jgi:DDE superfamily endonuclease
MSLKRKCQKKLQELVKSNEYEIYFQDECHFKLTLTIIRAWFLKGSFPEIKSPTDRFKMSVFGALGVNGQLILDQSEIFNAVTFQNFLEKIVIEATVGVTDDCRKKKILVVLDNARYHHAKIIQPWLEEMKDVIELFFLPPYSPDLNAIEMLWKKTRRAVTHNRFFESLDNLKYDLKMYWNQFNSINDELKLLTAFI